MKCDENKKELIEFLLKDWSDARRFVDMFRGDKKLYVNCGTKFFLLKLNNDGLIECSEEDTLENSQEEADTKVFLCAQHASGENESLCIKTVDSDIGIYSLYFHDKIAAKQYIEIGVGNYKRILDVGYIASELGLSMCNSLPALHCFTGNDYTSAFYGVGKVKAFNLLRRFEEFHDTFTQFGNYFLFEASLFASIEVFVCKMYGINCANTDEARYKKFCNAKKKLPEPQQLPPTRDALLCHCKRVSYATAIIKKSLTQFPNIPGPDGYGWMQEGNALKVQWMLRKPAPDEVLDLISCSCKKSCKTNSCLCKSHGVECSDLCGCDDECENKDDGESNDDVDENDDDSDIEFDMRECSEDEND